MDTEYQKHVLQIQTLCRFSKMVDFTKIWQYYKQGPGQDSPLANIKRVLSFCGACSGLSLVTENVD